MAIEIVDLPINSMVIFHSFLMLFVCLPEGNLLMFFSPEINPPSEESTSFFGGGAL